MGFLQEMLSSEAKISSNVNWGLAAVFIKYAGKPSIYMTYMFLVFGSNGVNIISEGSINSGISNSPIVEFLIHL